VKNIIIIGGDSRMSFLAKRLSNEGFSLVIYAQNEGGTKTELLKALKKEEPKDIILPLPVSRDKLNINTLGEYEKISLKELFGYIKPYDKIFGGILPEELKEKALSSGTDAFDYYDDELVVLNARLTAQCVLPVIKEYVPGELRGKRIAVTGYGRTAKAISEVMRKSGAKVLVTARNPVSLGKAVRAGNSICLLRDYDCIAHDADIIINTVPAQIIDEKIIRKLKREAVIIDIASSPYGVDFDCAEKFGITAVKALSLPGKYAPGAAGDLIFQKIRPLL